MFRTLLARLLPPPPPPAAALPANEPPPWATELAEGVTKAVRATTRLGLKLDELQTKVEAGFDDVRKAAAPDPQTHDLSGLLDAMDLLEDLAAREQGELAVGLRQVVRRLEGQARAFGLRRVDVLGQPPDGRLVRVVATEPDADVAPGCVCRVLGAPVLRGTQVVREGSVVVFAPAAGAA